MAKSYTLSAEQVGNLHTAWAKMHVLCGILDPTMPESYFPKGRISTSHRKAGEIYLLLEQLVIETGNINEDED